MTKRQQIELADRINSGVMALVAIGVLFVSVNHLAERITTIAHEAQWVGYFVGIAIDVGLITSKINVGFCQRAGRSTVSAWAFVVIAGVFSACLNCWAFCKGLTPWTLEWSAGMAWGIFVPLAAFLLGMQANESLVSRALGKKPKTAGNRLAKPASRKSKEKPTGSAG